MSRGRDRVSVLIESSSHRGLRSVGREMVGTVVVAVQRRSVRCRTYQKMSALAPSSTREIRACGGGSTKVSIKICASAARVTGLSGEPGGAQRLQGVASHGGGAHILKGFSTGAQKRPVMLSRPSKVTRKRWAATPGAPRSFASFVAQERCRISRPFCTLRSRCSSLRGSVLSERGSVAGFPILFAVGAAAARSALR